MSMFAQSDFSCGAPDMTLAEIQALRNGLGLAPSGFINHNLPVWFYVVIPEIDDPNNPYTPQATPSQLIQGANEYFSDPALGIQFYLCGISFIANNSFYLNLGFNQFPAIQAAAQSINPNYNNVINVYIVQGLIGGNAGHYGLPIAPNPGAIYLGTGGQDSKAFAHELGHYFSLAHTHAGGPTVTDTLHPEAAQYVNDIVFLSVNGVLDTFTCWETGDYICDTPADPYKRTNPANNCSFNSNCLFTGCTPFPNDPFGIPYTPDPSLLMSYYNHCYNTFTPQQKTQMRQMLTQHDNWAFLIDAVQPSCQNYFTSDFGLVRQNCDVLQIPPKPIKRLFVALEDAMGASCGAFVPKTNIEGIYSTILCVNPYNGNGTLDLLPDVMFASPKNGVDAFDLTLISKHILGIEALTTPYQFIAADANNSASITTADVVDLRKLILGIYTELPNNKNWRFVPQLCLNDPVFAGEFYDLNQPGINPFNAVWTNPVDQTMRTYGAGIYNDAPNNISWTDHLTLDPNAAPASNQDTWSFLGVKVGDLNCTAILTGLNNSLSEPDDEFVIQNPLPVLNTNQVFTLKIKSLENEPVTAWQIGLEFSEETMELLEVLPGNSGETFSTDNFGLTEAGEGKIQALNFSETGTGLNLNDKILFQLVFKAKIPISDVSQHFQLKNAVLAKKFYEVDGLELEDYALALSLSLNPFGKPGVVDSGTNADVNANPAAYPVPFGSELNVDFYMNEAESIEFRLFDQFRKLVKSNSEAATKGQNSIKLTGLETLPTGFYWYTLTGTGFTSTGKALKN